ncbi:MAG: hypothetical protein EHM40_00320 [Chloroflexi bacterium]|nr:MAG: hypothetical protein EHM40_16250 [Chloroflexota bacterium]RPI96851.1 MAG: hypothetical protein EHM40_00320 [Chloroflexota bacterium]
MKKVRPLLFFVSVLLLVGLACRFGDGGETPEPPPTEVSVQVDEPTSAPEPTEPPVTEVPEPTEPPTPEAQQFYTEEFDNPLSSDWTTRIDFAHPNITESDKVTVQAEDGKLLWDFGNKYVYYYLFYGAYEYEDVVLEVHAENRGKNNNSVSLICRYDPEVGWYEFNITNSGLYDISFVKILSNGRVQYNRVANGGSTHIKAGLDVNEYYAKCEGNELTLKINGMDVTSIQDKKYAELSKGQVGISVSSFNVLPIRIDMDWFKVSEP